MDETYVKVAGHWRYVYRAIDQFKATPQYADLMREYLSSSSEVFMKPVAGRKTYTVKAGDTLSKIAKEHLGDANAYMTIFEANKDQLTDPDKIKPGQVLKIPAAR